MYIYFLINLDSITNDVLTQAIHHNDNHTCQGIKTQEDVESPHFRNMLTAIASLFSLAVLMFIIYTGLARYNTKNTFKDPLPTKIICYTSV